MFNMLIAVAFSTISLTTFDTPSSNMPPMDGYTEEPLTVTSGQAFFTKSYSHDSDTWSTAGVQPSVAHAVVVVDLNSGGEWAQSHMLNEGLYTLTHKIKAMILGSGVDEYTAVDEYKSTDNNGYLALKDPDITFSRIITIVKITIGD